MRRSGIACAFVLLLHLLLFWAAPARAADTGGPIFRDTCTQIPTPVTNKVLCWEQTTQVLKFWNGSAWAPLTGGTAGVTSVTGTAGQILAVPTIGPVIVSLVNTAVTPGSYGNATNVASITVDAKGRVTAAANVPITAGVTSIAGTANQITASAATGAVTLSTPSAFIAPGSITATTSLTAPLWATDATLTQDKGVGTGVDIGATIAAAYAAGANQITLPRSSQWTSSRSLPTGKTLDGSGITSIIGDGSTFLTWGPYGRLANVKINDANSGGSPVQNYLGLGIAYGLSGAIAYSQSGQDIGINVVKSGPTGSSHSVGITSTHTGLGSGDNFYAQTDSTATEYFDALYRGDIKGSVAGGGMIFFGLIQGGGAGSKGLRLAHQTITYTGDFISVEGRNGGTGTVSGATAIRVTDNAVPKFHVTMSGRVGIGLAADSSYALTNSAVGGDTRNALFVTSDWVFGTTGSGLEITHGAGSGNTTTSLQAVQAGGGGSNTLVLQPGGGIVTVTGALGAGATTVTTLVASTSASTPQLLLTGTTSGTLTVKPAAIAGTNTLTLPAGTTDFSATGGASQVVKQTSAGGAFTVASVNFTDLAGTCTTAQGCLALTAAAVGDLIYASATTPTWSRLAIGAAGAFVRSTGTLPAWSTLILPNAATTGDTLIATGTNAVGVVAASALGKVPISQGAGTAWIWSSSVLLNANTGTVPTATTGTLLQIGLVDATAGGILVDGAAAATRIWCRRSGGTFAVPLATTAAATICNFGGLVYDTTDLYATDSAVAIQFLTINAASSTDHSTSIVLQTTPIASVTRATVATFTNASALLTGNPMQLRTTQTTVPTCSSNCGTSPSVAGTDTAGQVTMGATGSPASGWVVTFNGTWGARPSCNVWASKSGMVTGKKPIVIVTTTTTITVTTDGTAPANSDTYDYHCIGVA